LRLFYFVVIVGEFLLLAISIDQETVGVEAVRIFILIVYVDDFKGLIEIFSFSIFGLLFGFKVGSINSDL
jgi:hypothetical protein